MSSSQAIAFHSINIGEKNTWDDWRLVPTSRPLVTPPEVKTHFVQIPGSNDIIDLTEALAGRPVYGNRTGSWEFLVINSGQLEANSDYGEWYERYTDIMSYLHGSEYDVILDDDPNFYYSGRLSVAGWNSRTGNSTISISYNFDPYKRDIHGANSRWLWDPFCFDSSLPEYEIYGVIRTYDNLVVRDSLTVVFIAGTVSTIPVITCSASGMTVKYDGVTYNLKKGENVMNHIHFAPGNNTLKFTGNGRVTIDATGGIL